MKQWPADDVNVQVTSPKLDYDEYFTDELDKTQIIDTMVGDLQRIIEYPKLGYQVCIKNTEKNWKLRNTLY